MEWALKNYICYLSLDGYFVGYKEHSDFPFREIALVEAPYALTVPASHWGDTVRREMVDHIQTLADAPAYEIRENGEITQKELLYRALHRMNAMLEALYRRGVAYPINGYITDDGAPRGGGRFPDYTYGLEAKYIFEEPPRPIVMGEVVRASAKKNINLKVQSQKINVPSKHFDPSKPVINVNHVGTQAVLDALDDAMEHSLDEKIKQMKLEQEIKKLTEAYNMNGFIVTDGYRSK